MIYVININAGPGRLIPGREVEKMKKKYTYFFNGKIVRKSDRVYKFGLADEDNEITMCSGTYDGCLREKARLIKDAERGLSYAQRTGSRYVDVYLKALKRRETYRIVNLEMQEN